MFVSPCLAQLLGGSGPSIPGARSNVPPIIDWPRKAARGSTIFPYRSSRVENEVFPRQCISSRETPASPWSKGLGKILTYKENTSCQPKRTQKVPQDRCSSVGAACSV